MLFDLAIPIAYLLIVALIGWRTGRSTHDADSLFLAGRSMGWGLVGLSLFASNVSSTTLIGLSGAAYSSGIAVASYEWMAALALIFAAVVLIPVYLRNRLHTLPEYMEQRFDGRSRRYVSGVMIFLSIIIDTAGSLYAGTLVLQVFVPELPLWPTLIGLGLFAGIYTAAGGLRAVIITDAVQAIILLAGSVAISCVAFSSFDWSWEAVRAAVPADHLHMIRPADDAELPWRGLLLGLPIMGLYYWTTNQYISQRFLAARDIGQARKGALLAAGLKLLPLFIMVLPGAMAVALFPDLQRGDEVYPMLVKELLPAGLRGLVLAGLLAAIMSTIDSTLNAASALTLYDFFRLDKRAMDRRRQLRIGRLTTLGFMLLAIAWAPVIRNFPGLFNYLQQVFAYSVPPVLIVFLAGVLWPGAHPRAAFGTLALGHTAGLVLFVASQTGVWPLHFTVDAGLLAAFSALVMVLLSHRLKRTVLFTVETELLFRSADAASHEGAVWWRDYRMVALSLVLATALIVFAFA